MHQPWASLLVHGIKRIEGRSWPAPLTGRLWIHAASKVPDSATIKAMEDFYREIYAVNGITNLKFPEHYPVSRLLGCVEVVGCVKCEELVCWEDVPEGVRLEGQTDFCWLCEKPQKLVVPFEMRGYQGVYNLDSKIFEAVFRGLCPVKGPLPVKFPLPEPQNTFSLKPGSLSLVTGSKGSIPEIPANLCAVIAGARAAATQFSKTEEKRRVDTFQERPIFVSSTRQLQDHKHTEEDKKPNAALQRRPQTKDIAHSSVEPNTSQKWKGDNTNYGRSFLERPVFDSLSRRTQGNMQSEEDWKSNVPLQRRPQARVLVYSSKEQNTRENWKGDTCNGESSFLERRPISDSSSRQPQKNNHTGEGKKSTTPLLRRLQTRDSFYSSNEHDSRETWKEDNTNDDRSFESSSRLPEDNNHTKEDRKSTGPLPRRPQARDLVYSHEKWKSDKSNGDRSFWEKPISDSSVRQPRVNNHTEEDGKSTTPLQRRPQSKYLVHSSSEQNTHDKWEGDNTNSPTSQRNLNQIPGAPSKIFAAALKGLGRT
ncbi:Activating signal cointegrator [Thalictrum thalictroides]|uniref:Activating signal cointegrator n=1 Tax=Thalictrum thalictroides TaxID=46969 RepID=A0A7J6WMI3_THATH|nr:Activating signal cointegrator [Thalictrum thalictroides]